MQGDTVQEPVCLSKGLSNKNGTNHTDQERRREQPAQIQTDNPTFQGYCLSLDYADELAKFRSMFIIPEERDIDASKIFNPTGMCSIGASRLISRAVRRRVADMGVSGT